jgi:hypothetical protein
LALLTEHGEVEVPRAGGAAAGSAAVLSEAAE